MASARASLPRNAIRADQKSASSRTLIAYPCRGPGLCDRRCFGIDPQLEDVSRRRNDPETRIFETSDGGGEFVDRHRIPQTDRKRGDAVAEVARVDRRDRRHSL